PSAAIKPPSTGAMMSTIALPMVSTSKRVWVMSRKSGKTGPLAGLEHGGSRRNRTVLDDGGDQRLDILAGLQRDLPVEQQHGQPMHPRPGRQRRHPPLAQIAADDMAQGGKGG